MTTTLTPRSLARWDGLHLVLDLVLLEEHLARLLDGVDRIEGVALAAAGEGVFQRILDQFIDHEGGLLGAGGKGVADIDHGQPSAVVAAHHRILLGGDVGIAGEVNYQPVGEGQHIAGGRARVCGQAGGLQLAGGQGKMKGRLFRIGHLGMLTDAMVLSGLATVEMVMVDLGLDIELGSGVAAAQGIYRHGSKPALKKEAA